MELWELWNHGEKHKGQVEKKVPIIVASIQGRQQKQDNGSTEEEISGGGGLLAAIDLLPLSGRSMRVFIKG